MVPGLDSLQRWAWVADALTRLDGSGIVYVLTVAEADRLAGFLSSLGLSVAAYSGRLDTEERLRVENELRDNRLKAVVATSALGMGYDKPDLAFCIHVGSPASPVAYYQQVGRAGRALDDALAVLLPSPADEPIWEYFATATIPNPDHVAKVLAALAAVDDDGRAVGASQATIEQVTGLRRGRLEGLLKLLAAEEVVVRSGQQWSATGKTYVHDEEKWSALRTMRRGEAELMRSYAAGAGCLMRFLQLALDDPEPSPCGRCSVCTGVLPDPGATPASELVQRAKTFARGESVVLEPRKLWPSGIAGRKGRIVGCDPGRALAFADDPGWTDALSRLAGRDGALPGELADGLVDMLRHWRTQWAQRPVAIVPMPSRTRPQLVRAIAEHLGGVGNLAVIDALKCHGPRPPADAASAARVSALFGGLSLDPTVPIPNGAVFLVDDTYRSGWTMTVAAGLLRDAGASAVLPVVLHQLP